MVPDKWSPQENYFFIQLENFKSILLIHKEIVLEKTSNSQVYKTKPL